MEDLNMTVQQYNTAVSILFVGYSELYRDSRLLKNLLTQQPVLMQVPSNLVVSKIRYPAVSICSAVCVWGAVSACTAAVHSYGGLLACRFMLGFVEAVFFPGLSMGMSIPRPTFTLTMVSCITGAFFYLSMFYNRKQIALRTAILYSGSQLGNAFGTLFAIGILKLDGRYGLEGWRWLFVSRAARFISSI